MLKVGVVLSGLLLTGIATPALAHHSFAMFDRTNRVTMNGEVKQLDFENPHSWLKVAIKTEQGQATVWSFEMGPPVVLRREGWAPTTVNVGDQITVQFYPMRDGSSAGQLISVKFPDGKVLAGGPTTDKGDPFNR
jgi:hypothetical protein